jgi:hypothetical protein
MANEGIVIIKRDNIIKVKSAFPIFPNFQNFSLIATGGQTVFTLPAYPILTGLFSLNINGTMQDELNGDYTISGNVLTVNAVLSAGDKLAGFFQAMSQNLNPSVLNYRTFFFTATQGQTIFNIGFIPTAIIYVAVNGTIQAVGEGDYTVNGALITMSAGLNAGDKFFGLATQ